jgi:osmotically-inducible protein OsmY
VRYIRGVRHVVNRITVVPKATGRDLWKHIAKALHRNAALDAARIEVSESHGVVTLKGAATTWLQRQAAERAAYDVPGITMVDNQIVVEPPEEEVWRDLLTAGGSITRPPQT